MKNKILVIILILICNYTFGNSKRETLSIIEKGIYYGEKGGFLRKYVIANVQDSIAYVECYVRWQGQWVNFIRLTNLHSENKIKLTLENGRFSNYPVTMFKHNEKIWIKIDKTMLGKTKVKVVKTIELPKKTNVIRNSALLFNTNEIKFKSIEDSLAFIRLKINLEMNHDDFFNIYNSIVNQ